MPLDRGRPRESVSTRVTHPTVLRSASSTYRGSSRPSRVRSPFSFGGAPRCVRVAVVPEPRHIRCLLALRRRWLALIGVGQDPTESAPRHEDRICDAAKARPRNPFLPWFSVMALRQDGVGCGGAHRGTERGE